MFGSADYGSIGPYRIVRRLGVQTTHEVFLAIRRFPSGFERRVVIKRLLGQSQWEPEQHRVVASEALAYTRVAHPAIVQLLDVVSFEGDLALVLEYVDGPSLARLLASMHARHEHINDTVAKYIASRVFAGLAAAHAARDPQSGEPTPVIHRDVSPENVRIPWDGFVKLGDFNLAKVIGVSSDTRAGLIKGTYGYMAPEQVDGEPITTSTDVYAGCLVLRELLLARPAFQENLPELELLRAMSESKLEPIEALRKGIPSRLADAMRRGLARDPAERTLTAGEMVHVLRDDTDMESTHAELTALLARARRQDSRSDEPSRTSRTPSSISAMTSIPPVAMDLSSTIPPSSFEFLSPEIVGLAGAGTGTGARERRSAPRLLLDSALDSAPVVAVTNAASSVSRSVSNFHEETVRTILGAAQKTKVNGARNLRIAGAAGAIALIALLGGGLGYILPTQSTSESASGASTASTRAVAGSAPSTGSAGKSANSADSESGSITSAPETAAPTGSPAHATEGAMPTEGLVVVPSSARQHRISLDGHYVMPLGGGLHVACGKHTLRIGTRGVTQNIVVPCGGTLIVEGH